MLRIVHTGCGAIEGIAAPEPEITVFRGIPFAAPPVGGDAMRLGQRTRMIRDWSTNVERNALLQWGGAAAD